MVERSRKRDDAPAARPGPAVTASRLAVVLGSVLLVLPAPSASAPSASAQSEEAGESEAAAEEAESEAAAEESVQKARLKIWDIDLGTHIQDLPEREFFQMYCGTNGGAPSLPLEGFADYAMCPPEPETGLHEVYFEYDDEAWYRAMAHENQYLADQIGRTREFGFDVIASVLVDSEGIIQGKRLVTDPRVSIGTVFNASIFGIYAMGRFGQGWECVDHPRTEGYEPAAFGYVDRTCEEVDAEAGTQMYVGMQNFRKPGQHMIDPHNQQANQGSRAFYNDARFEMYLAEAPLPEGYVVSRSRRLGTQQLGRATVVPEIVVAASGPLGAISADAGAVDDFLAGKTQSCPGCDLTGVDLKGRDLNGADFTGAILVEANFHRASLREASFVEADLTRANLNKTILRQANFARANLTNAMFYEADLAAAVLEGAVMNGVLMQHSRLMQANLAGVELNGGNLTDSQMLGINFEGAILRNTWMDRVNMNRAVLLDAKMNPVSLWQAQLKDVDARNVDFQGSDFLEAMLVNANLENANLRGTRLYRANMHGAQMTGAILAGAVMPDGTVVPDER